MKTLYLISGVTDGSRRAFTLCELLVIIAVAAVLVPLFGIGLARTDPSVKALQCLYNTRQLVVGWQMYAQEYHDKLLPVLHGGEAQGGAGDPVWGCGWVEGWLDWTLSPDNTNTIFLTNPRYAKIAPYLRGATNVFKCPADRYLSSIQQSVGWGQRARSYVASLAVGAGNAESGPWDTLYAHISKMTDFVYPGPANVFVYLDEHPDSINDPGLFPPHQSAMVDFPATFHNDGAGISFADGHAEIHKWTGCMSVPSARQVHFSYGINLGTVLPGDPDIHWLSYHTPRKTATSY